VDRCDDIALAHVDFALRQPEAARDRRVGALVGAAERKTRIQRPAELDVLHEEAALRLLKARCNAEPMQRVFVQRTPRRIRDV
jgi:hypothetical protein